MIEFLRGKLIRRSPAQLLIDVGGVGYAVNVSLRTSEAAGAEGREIGIITYLHVREEAMELFGFQDATEKALFLMLLGVSGIGPRLALRILSSTSPGDLGRMISGGDIRALTSLKGIGKKTAEVMVASLRASIAKLSWDSPSERPFATAETDSLRDAVLGLVTLGVKEPQAEAAVRKAAQKAGEKASAGQLIALALQEV